MGTMRGERQFPDGLQYVEDFLSEAEEAALIEALAGIDYRTFELRGQVARRTVRTFGYSYDFDARSVTEIEPLPEWLVGLRERCAAFAEVDPESFVHALINRARRSAYVLGGLARSAWQHSIPAIEDLRYSITFRTLKRMPADAAS